MYVTNTNHVLNWDYKMPSWTCDPLYMPDALQLTRGQKQDVMRVAGVFIPRPPQGHNDKHQALRVKWGPAHEEDQDHSNWKQSKGRLDSWKHLLERKLETDFKNALLLT